MRRRGVKVEGRVMVGSVLGFTLRHSSIGSSLVFWYSRHHEWGVREMIEKSWKEILLTSAKLLNVLNHCFTIFFD